MLSCLRLQFFTKNDPLISTGLSAYWPYWVLRESIQGFLVSEGASGYCGLSSTGTDGARYIYIYIQLCCVHVPAIVPARVSVGKWIDGLIYFRHDCLMDGRICSPRVDSGGLGEQTCIDSLLDSVLCLQSNTNKVPTGRGECPRCFSQTVLVFYTPPTRGTRKRSEKHG